MHKGDCTDGAESVASLASSSSGMASRKRLLSKASRLMKMSFPRHTATFGSPPTWGPCPSQRCCGTSCGCLLPTSPKRVEYASRVWLQPKPPLWPHKQSYRHSLGASACQGLGTVSLAAEGQWWPLGGRGCPS